MTAGTAPVALSPAMLAVLVTLRDGAQPDGRSWRAANALKVRGLVVTSAEGWQLTEAGRDRLAAGMVINGVQR